MVDLHSHVMYGWDDGAVTMEDSIEMARMAAEDGTRVLAATPHLLWDKTRVDPGMVRDRVAEINDRVAAEGLDITIVVGTEMQASWDWLMPLKHKEILTLNDSRAVLFEPPFRQLPLQFPDLVFQIRLLGLIPLLAHPERCEPFLADRDLFNRMVDEDMPIQITAGSLLGSFGDPIKEFAWELVETERPVLIASDAHGTKRRRPVLSEARAALAEKFGEATAELMCSTNAAALIENRTPRIAKIKRPQAPDEKVGFGGRLKRVFGH